MSIEIDDDVRRQADRYKYLVEVRWPQHGSTTHNYPYEYYVEAALFKFEFESRYLADPRGRRSWQYESPWWDSHMTPGCFESMQLCDYRNWIKGGRVWPPSKAHFVALADCAFETAMA